MATRRIFLQTGLAAAALPVATRAALVDLPGEVAAVPFYKIVFDRRFSAGLAFAEQMQRIGMPVHGISGDVTDLWFRDLDLRWKRSPAAIAGLTGERGLFCLDLLARDRGMRVVYRVEHRLGPEGSLQPQLPPILSWLPRTNAPAVEPRVPKLADDADRLVSWVIAPRWI